MTQFFVEPGEIIVQQMYNEFRDRARKQEHVVAVAIHPSLDAALRRAKPGHLSINAGHVYMPYGSIPLIRLRKMPFNGYEFITAEMCPELADG